MAYSCKKVPLSLTGFPRAQYLYLPYLLSPTYALGSVGMPSGPIPLAAICCLTNWNRALSNDMFLWTNHKVAVGVRVSVRVAVE